MPVTENILDRLLDPVGKALTPEAARQLLDVQADPDIQARMDELADGANEGTLDSDQRAEYEALVTTANVIAILQAKARTVLKASSAK